MERARRSVGANVACCRAGTLVLLSNVCRKQELSKIPPETLQYSSHNEELRVQWFDMRVCASFEALVSLA